MTSKLNQGIFVSVIAGIVTGLTTIFVIPVKFELLVWGLLIIAIALFAKRNFNEKLYVNAFLLAILTGVCITLTHLLFLDSYLDSHASEIAGLDEIKIFNSYVWTLLAIAPVYWVVLGIVSCLVIFLTNKVTTGKSV